MNAQPSPESVLRPARIDPPPVSAVRLPGTVDDSRVLTRWSIALALFSLGLSGRFALIGILPPVGYPFLTFFPAVLLTAYCVGLVPGLAVSVAAVVSAWYFFVEPSGSFALVTADAIALVFFAAILLIDCAIIHLMRQAMQRSSLAQAELAAAVHQAQARQQLLDATFNAVPASIVVADAKGRLVRMNKATESVWGPAPLSPDVSSYAEWKGWWADGSSRHGQRLEPTDWGLARSLQGEPCTQQVEIEPFDQPGVRRTTLLSAAPVFDQDGRVAGGVVAQVDISERVRAEEALRDSEQRFRTLADHIPQLAWMADPQGNIQWFNRRWFEFTGASPQEMAGGRWRSVHHPDHLERTARLFDAHMASGDPWEDTFPLRAADGSYRWFLSRALPMKDAQGRVLRWFGTNTDVTDQQATEQSLRDANRQKDVFLATLAHELRNPLAPIRAAGQIVTLSHGGQERLARAAAVIERQSAQLARLVDDLMDLARVRSGTLSLRLDQGDLRDAIGGAVETVEPVLTAAGQVLHLHGTDEPLLVRFDRARALQCIANVLHNASKFSPPGSRIELIASREADLVRVRVRDHGQGVPPDILPHVFDLFVQERQSGVDGQSGLGIGLALTQHLMELHGGSARMRSAGRNMGTELELDWPLHGAADGHPGTEPEGQRPRLA